MSDIVLTFPVKDALSLALSAIAAVVAFLAFFLNYRHNRRVAMLSRKPVLVFEYDGTRGWFIKNVGGGPALNILVAQKQPHGEWFRPVRIPPMAKDGELLLSWLGHVSTTGLGAIYTDSESNPYTAICGNDLSRVFNGHLFGPWEEPEIGKHWNQPSPVP